MSKPQLYWQSVEPEQPLSSHYTLAITPTLIADQVSGSQDYNIMHHDGDFARSQGAPDMYLNTGFIEALLGRLITDWIGDAGWLKQLSTQMRRFNILGDQLTIQGKVTKKFIEGDEALVECEIWIENDREGVSVTGKALVSLPQNNNN